MKIRCSKACWLVAVLPFLALVGHAAEPRPASQPWHRLAEYPTKGLSPPYDEVATEIGRMLESPTAWTVLPRPVDAVFVAPEYEPCFEMHMGDMYYTEHFGNAEAVRWAARQTFDGPFRLFYNTAVRTRHNDRFCVVVDGFSKSLGRIEGDQWKELKVPGFRSGAAVRPHQIAADPGGGWWIATAEGLFHFATEFFERADLSDAPVGRPLGVAGGGGDRLVAWFEPRERREESRSPAARSTVNPVAFLSEGKWEWTDAHHYGNWTKAAMRPDGSAILAGDRDVALVSHPSSTQPDGEGDQDDVRERLRQGLFRIGDGTWVRPVEPVCLAADGTCLFRAVCESGGANGFVRVPAGASAHWIDFAHGPVDRFQLAAQPDGGFLMLAMHTGLWTLAASDPCFRHVADVADFLPGDVLLGCDHRGRAYFKRSEAILVFTPEAPPAETIEALELASVTGVEDHDPRFAAVSTCGDLWFVSPGTRNMMTLAHGEQVVRRADARLRNARALWPGRDGAMLVLRADGQAALVCGDGQVALAGSLRDLCVQHFDDVMAVAPTTTHDVRRDLTRHTPLRPIPPPWLTVGRSLWISDGEAVYRLRRDADTQTNPGVQWETIRTGRLAVFGPLRSGKEITVRCPLSPGGRGQGEPILANGDLLLAPIILADLTDIDLIGRRTSWLWVNDPDGAARVGSVSSPGEAVLEQPATLRGQWQLDGTGALWLHQDHDRVYRITSPDCWLMLKDFGAPEFEFPAGFVWGWRTDRVFPGYEVGGQDYRSSCTATYLQHITPLVADDREVLCMTPDGLARLRFHPEEPERASITDRVRVRWRDTPEMFLGAARGRAFFVTFDAYRTAQIVFVKTSPSLAPR